MITVTNPRRSEETMVHRPNWVELTDWHVIVILAVLVFAVWLWLHYLVPQEHRSKELDPATMPVWIRLAYPEYIAVGDQGYIDVTVGNMATGPISVVVVVDFIDGHIVQMSESETNKVEIKDLAPSGRHTSRIGFILNEAPYFYGLAEAPPPVWFDVKAVDMSGSLVNVFPNQPILLAPFPHLRALQGLLMPGGVITGLLTVLKWLWKSKSSTVGS